MKHCAARPDADALWLCQPTPVSTMPKTVMPCQVSWQFVAIKRQPSMHALGAEAAVAAEAPVGTASAAHASTPQEALPAARSTAAKVRNFAMRASLAQQARLYVGTNLVGNTESAP